LTEKEKTAPRHQRENQLKEKTSSASGPRGAHSHLTEKENLPRATGARRISGSLFPHKRERQQPEKYRYLQNKIRSFSITT